MAERTDTERLDRLCARSGNLFTPSTSPAREKKSWAWYGDDGVVRTAPTLRALIDSLPPPPADPNRPAAVLAREFPLPEEG